MYKINIFVQKAHEQMFDSDYISSELLTGKELFELEEKAANAFRKKDPNGEYEAYVQLFRIPDISELEKDLESI